MDNKKVTTIYIIRHGQTDNNQAQQLQGRNDTLLNETGIQEAHTAALWFQSRGITFDQVYSSPLVRAVRTAAIVSGEQRILTDDRLLEMDYGPYEGMPLTDPAPEVIEFFKDFTHNPAPEGMEQLSSVVSRMGSFLESVKDQSGNILIATHAVAMKGALEYLTPESNGSYWSKYIGNCEVYRTEVINGQFSIPQSVYRQGEIKVGV